MDSFCCCCCGRNRKHTFPRETTPSRRSRFDNKDVHGKVNFGAILESPRMSRGSYERNNSIIPTLHYLSRGGGGQSGNKLYNYTLIKDSALRWYHTVSICNFTHVIRRNIMKSTLVHVSLNEITVSFQLCTI